MDNIIIIKDISYTYPNGVKALDKVNMKVKKGERLGIIGPNGAGKSTLLMIMDLLYKPDSGLIFIFGTLIDENRWRNKDKLREIRGRIGFVFQDPDIQLFSNTVWEDIAFSCIYSGKDKEETIDIVNRVLDLLEISHLADRHPYNLSYGERRIAAIATILPLNPEIILLDEPTSNLDAKYRGKIIRIIEKLHSLGKTIVVASHDISLIMRVSDRIYLLNKRIILEGKPQDIMRFKDILVENGIIEEDTMIKNINKINLKKGIHYTKPAT